KLVAARDLELGHLITEQDIAIKSPADGGLPPYELERLGGRRLRRPLAFEGFVTFDDVEPLPAEAQAAAQAGADSGRCSRGVRMAVFDFDGVFTDNRVWVNERGEEILAFSRSDGLGLRRLDEVGVRYLIVSMEANPIVAARAKKLDAECVQGVHDKLAVVRER